MRRDDIHADLQQLEGVQLGTSVQSMPACLVEVGQTASGPTMLDLGRLLSTRLLIQAGSGDVCSACGRRQEANAVVERASPRLSPQERLERAFSVLQSLLDGTELADLAVVFDVTEHAVRCWLHEALCHFNLPRLGIRGHRVRVSALREHAEAILGKLASARSSAERDLRRQARNAH